MFLSLVFVKYQRDHVQLSGTDFLLFDFHFDLKVKDVGLKPMKIVLVGFVHFLVWKICLKQYYWWFIWIAIQITIWSVSTLVKRMTTQKNVREMTQCRVISVSKEVDNILYRLLIHRLSWNMKYPPLELSFR